MTLADLGADVVKIEPRERRSHPRRRRPRSARSRPRTPRSIAASARSPSTCAPRRARPSCARWRRRPTSSWRASVPASSTSAASGAPQLLRGASAPRLLLGHRLRPGRARTPRAPGHDIELRGARRLPRRQPRRATAVPCVPVDAGRDMTAGLLAVIGILAALQARERTGRGQHVDVSLLRGVALAHDAAPDARAGRRPAPRRRADRAPIACYTVYRCRDGQVARGRGAGAEVLGRRLRRAWAARSWPRAAVGAGRGARATRERPGRAVRVARPRRVGARPRRRTTSASSRCSTPTRCAAHADHRRGAARPAASEARTLRTVAPPLELSSTPAAARRAPRRGLGEHTDAVLRRGSASRAPT